MHLLIPAAGRGSRMGADVNKLLLPLLGRPLLAWTLAAAAKAPSTGWIGIIGQPIDEEAIRLLVEKLGLRVPVQWIEGGETRQQSVYWGCWRFLQTRSRYSSTTGRAAWRARPF